MARLKACWDKYADEDFRKAVFTAMIGAGMDCSITKLAESIGVSKSCLNKNLRHTTQHLNVDVLRKIIQIIQPDIHATLALLGYTGKQIKYFKEH